MTQGRGRNCRVLTPIMGFCVGITTEPRRGGGGRPWIACHTRKPLICLQPLGGLVAIYPTCLAHLCSTCQEVGIASML